MFQSQSPFSSGEVFHLSMLIGCMQNPVDGTVSIPF